MISRGGGESRRTGHRSVTWRIDHAHLGAAALGGRGAGPETDINYLYHAQRPRAQPGMTSWRIDDAPERRLGAFNRLQQRSL